VEHRYRTLDNNGNSGLPLSNALAPLKVQEIVGNYERLVDGVIVSDQSADPYAHFLSSKRSVFQAELAKRGYPNLPPDRGSPFVNRKWEYLTPPISGIYRRTSTTRHEVINGLLAWTLPTGQSHLFSGWTGGIGPDSAPDLAAFAQRALADARPSLAEFSLSTFLGEIREGLPKLLPAALMRDKGSFFRSVGSDYLNVQFGWIPFITTLRDLGYSLYRAQHKLNAITGTPVRRHVRGPRFQDSRQFNNVPLRIYTGPRDGGSDLNRRILSGIGPNNGNITDAIGIGQVIETIDSSLNFSGSFVTLLPKSFDDNTYIDRLNQLIDVRITPSVLWQLAPWSWLVDWFFDIQGTIDSNSLATDETLLIHYAYASYKAKYRQMIWGNSTNASWTGPNQLYGLTEGTYYKRVRANPYGFTVGTFGGLNTSQLAILAALGLSRGR